MASSSSRILLSEIGETRCPRCQSRMLFELKAPAKFDFQRFACAVCNNVIKVKPNGTWEIDRMTIEVRVPHLKNPGPKLSVGRWFKSVGKPVTIDEPLVEIDTDNVTHEIKAPVTGVLSSIAVKDGGTVDVGTLLGTIRQL